MIASHDIAIIGSGFAGSLMAMIAKRLGYSVILLERGRHPRVTIGESSTPLANLLLEELSRRYNLPTIKPLAKWGSWQENYPEVACGLKRGFTFYHHLLGAPDAPDPNRENQLLVAASPHDQIADTHWYRADFDLLLVQQAKKLGGDYLEDVALHNVVELEAGVSFDVVKDGTAVAHRAKFLIDATGPRGFLHNHWKIPELVFPDYPETSALYNHFSGVTRPCSETQVKPYEAIPYPPEDAAVHHVFEGGWIWVLRFNNGITSAGAAVIKEAAARFRLEEGEIAWHRLLNLIPTLKEQFTTARAEQPFRHLSKLSYRTSRACGNRWVMLPSAAGFVDPLLSTGFPLTLLGITRLADVLAAGLDSPRLSYELHAYADRTMKDLFATSRLVAALYANMKNFAVFKSLCLLYFAAASYSETVRRLNKPHLAESFLLYDNAIFGPSSRSLLERSMHIAPGTESEQLIEDILRAIEPFDVAGLTTQNQGSWYPVRATDLLASASKVDSTREEIEALLRACGFY